MTCDFQKCGILTSVDSDEPEQPSFMLKCCSVSSLTFIEYSSDKQRLLSDCGYAQAGLSLCWSHISNCWKSHVVAQISELRMLGNFYMLLSLSADFSKFNFKIKKNSFRNTIRVSNGPIWVQTVCKLKFISR